MANVIGSLASVNSVPTEGTVLLRALDLRPGSTFAVTGEPKVAVIRGGRFVIEDVEPGPVQLTIQGNGVTHDVRVDVPDEDEVDFLDLLDNVYEWEPAQISAVKLAAREARRSADEAGRIAAAFRGAEQLEGWAESASGSAASAASSAGEAGRIAAAFRGAEQLEGWAESASGSAASAASSAGEAAVSAGAAAGSAAEAAVSAGEAAQSKADAALSSSSADAASRAATASASSAAQSESSAATHAQSALGYAGQAEDARDESRTARDEAVQAAGRAEGVVDSVSWDDDKLTVAGKTSPSLRGPKGEPGGVRGFTIEGVGTDPVASGVYSLAAGWDSEARGWFSTALGRGAKAEEDGATAMGYNARVLAGHINSTAIGYQATTTGPKQVRIGSTFHGYHVSLVGDVRLTNAPSRDDNATTKAYVDGEVAEAKAFAETRAVVKQVTSPPDTPEPGVLYVIPE